ncbi:isthmin-1-like [Diadema antillarum]|uniref:isthmin-1-like n=1 Tax=Diadema antillarum TaxID=105358 RepID=UPI003A842DBA
MAITFPSSAWHYLLFLAVFTLMSFWLITPGLLATIQIHQGRRDLVIDSQGLDGVTVPSQQFVSINVQTQENVNSRVRTSIGQKSRIRLLPKEKTKSSSLILNKVISTPRNLQSNIRDMPTTMPKPGSAASREEKVAATISSVFREEIDGSVDSTSHSENGDMSIDLEDYYTYDYDDYLEKDEYEKFPDQVKEPRSRKDAASIRTSEWRSMEQLAEIATNSNPSLGFVNLITPNPNLDITIEVVVNGEGNEEEDNQHLYESKTSTPSQPSTRPAKGYDGDLTGRKIDEWSDWSSCSASCGQGKKERHRTCGTHCVDTEIRQYSSIFVNSNVDSSMSVTTAPSDIIFDIDHGFTIDVVDDMSGVIDNTDIDRCKEWMECRSEKLVSYLKRLENLPSCPCLYPAALTVNSPIVDRHFRSYFRWVVVDLETSWLRLSTFKPTAVACIQSEHSSLLASQQCCYDRNQRLITRGQGAGTPQLISAKISRELNYKIDVLPWIICKGDWMKYNLVRPPNNGRHCMENPDNETYHIQVEEARDF